MTDIKACNLWHLASARHFAELSESEKEMMASFMTHINVKKSGYIYNAGDRDETLYIVMEGRIKTTRLSEDGKEITLEILEPGDIFGELTLAGEEERETSAVALEDSLICAVKRSDFEDFLHQSPLFAFSVTKLIGLRLRKIENRYENIIFKDVRSRLVSLFYDLADKYGEECPEGRKIKIRLSHQELSNLIGSTRETVTLELSKLKKSGEIITDGRAFILPQKKTA